MVRQLQPLSQEKHRTDIVLRSTLGLVGEFGKSARQAVLVRVDRYLAVGQISISNGGVANDAADKPLNRSDTAAGTILSCIDETNTKILRDYKSAV